MKKKLFFKFFIFAVIGAFVTLTSCKDYDDDISRLDTDLAALKADFVSKSDLNTLKTELDGKISALQSEITTLKGDLSKYATKAELDAAKADILSKTVTLESFNTFKTWVEGEITKLKADVAKAATKDELQALETLLNSKIADLRTDLAAHIANFDALKLVVDGHSAAIADIKDDLADQLALINANKDEIAAVKADLQAKYDELTAEIAALKDRVTDLESGLAALDTKVEAYKAELDGKIADLDTKLTGMIIDVRKLLTSRLTSIALAPNAYVDGIEAIKFTSLVYKPMAVGENTEVPTSGYNMAIGAPALASYKFNPRTFNLSNADYNYVDRTAEVITRAAAAASKLVAIEGAPKKNSTEGTVEFTLRRLNADKPAPQGNKENFVTLEATLKGAAVDANESGVVIAAHQELVYDNILNPSDIFISDKGTLSTKGGDAHYPVTFSAAASLDKIWYEVPYDKVFDLLAKVATCDVTDGHKEFNIADYNLTYKFSVASTAYNVPEGGTVTNQQDWVELVNATDGTYKAKGFNKELIGRTPILKVELVDQAGNVVRRAFVKVKFVAEKTADITVGESHTLVYKCDDTAAQFEITEQYIRDNVYRIITSGKETSMSHEEFWNTYDAATATTKVKKNGSNYTMTNVPKIVAGATGVGTATKKITWSFNHGELGQIGVNGSQFVASVTVKNKLTSSEFPEYVTFQFTVNVTLPNVNLPAANKVENDQYWSKNADGSYYAYKVNVAVPAATDSPAADAIFKTSLPQAYSKYIVNTAGACTTNFYKVVATYSNGVKTTNPLVGVQISGTDITLDKTNTAVKTALNSAGGLQASVAHIYKLENGEEITVNTFLVDFIRPVNLNMPSGISVKDAKTGGDIADFQWNGILTDWRGEFIVDGSWVDVDTDESFWANTYQPQYSWKDGYNQLTTPASLNVVMGEVSFTIGGSPVTVYTGTATYQVQRRTRSNNWPFDWNSWTNQGAATTLVSEQMLTEDQVNTWLDFKRTELVAGLPNNTYFTEYQLVEVTAPNVTSEIISGAGQVVQYSYVQSVTYVPAVYTWVPGEWVVAPHTPTTMPTVDGTHNGQVIGDWTWTVVITSSQEWAAGQYWDFYGPFSSIVADIAGVTTNLDYNGGQLPADVTLEQIGNTVKYVNVGAPVGYSYEIYIPVSVNYGWGELKSQLTITVDPVK